MARRAIRRWLPFIALLCIGSAILFCNYGSGGFSRWDEGLYGQFARNALTYRDYLLPLDTHGNYSREPFSKPPLSFLLVALSFVLFEPSIASLRLPFTLGMLVLALTCVAWGNDIARRLKLSPWLGFVWGLFVLLADSAMTWGRYAVIEDVFVMALVLALWLHARALTRNDLWSLLAGLALCFGFLIKQLAIGLVLLPMFVLELLHWRAHGAWRVLRRTLLWGIPPLAVALVWAFMAYAREGGRFAGMLWTFALVQRFQGYQGTTHFNTFNRVSGLLDSATYPFSWVLCALGLCTFAGYVLQRRRRASTRARGSQLAELSIVLFFLTAVLVLENATKSLLPWYVLSFVPSLAFGLAWLTTQAQRVLAACWLRPGRRPPAGSIALAAVAGCALFFAASRTLRQSLSEIDVVTLLLGAGLLAWFKLRSAERPPWVPRAALCAVLALLTLAHFRNVEYRQSRGTLEALMDAVGQARVTHPVLSAAIGKSDVESYEPVTMFGSQYRVGSAPWLDPAGAGTADGFADLFVIPSELDGPLAGRFARAPGATLFTGDLSTNPLPAEQVASLLEAGPLTFEAEAMSSGRSTSLVGDRKASGGQARRYKPWLSEGMKDHTISYATTLTLPTGDYVAEFYVRWRCGEQKGAEVGAVKAAKRQRRLSCKTPDHLDAYRAIPVRFSVGKPSGAPLAVTFQRGRGELWHDKTVIWREDVWKRRSEGSADE
jgi:4-amino-4-deoxy-L-arabinose transferase-like glycosyltransferase